MRNPLPVLLGIPARLLIVTIRLYQATLSPDHGPFKTLYRYGYCRHSPTCSQYSIEVLQHRSFPIALALMMKRILSCNPWRTPSDKRMLEAMARME